MDPIASTADAYLNMTPADFDDWLQSQEQKHHGIYGLLLTASLAGRLSEQWARDHANLAAS